VRSTDKAQEVVDLLGLVARGFPGKGRREWLAIFESIRRRQLLELHQCGGESRFDAGGLSQAINSADELRWGR